MDRAGVGVRGQPPGPGDEEEVNTQYIQKAQMGRFLPPQQSPHPDSRSSVSPPKEHLYS